MLKTVFVSSTFVDLQAHRKAVWNTLAGFDVTVRGMEQFGARTETPLSTCLLELEQSDIYVGIIGLRLGSIDPKAGKSYTQLEYEHALSLSKEIFIYLVDEENASVRVKDIDRPESLEKLESFKKILRERHTVDFYTNEADLAKKLQRDLERHLTLRAPARAGTDEFADSKSNLEAFLLLPKTVAGTEVRLKVRASDNPYPASRALCQAFNLEFGATFGIPIEILAPEGILPEDSPDLYVDAKHASKILPVKKGDLIEGYIKLNFSSNNIGEVRARFHPKVEYPDRHWLGGVIMGKPTRYEADTRLALELTKTIEVTRSAGGNVQFDHEYGVMSQDNPGCNKPIGDGEMDSVYLPEQPYGPMP
jgi:hypothetical protein